MDTKSTARIKVNFSLSFKPMKDIQIQYAELLSNSNPEKFAEIKRNLLFAIEASYSEYRVLLNELTRIKQVTEAWKQIQYDSQIEVYQSELRHLEHELNELVAKQKRVDALEAQKETLKKINIPNLTAESKLVEASVLQTQREIESVAHDNEIRKEALRQTLKNLELFLNPSQYIQKKTQEEENNGNDDDNTNDHLETNSQNLESENNENNSNNEENE